MSNRRTRRRRTGLTLVCLALAVGCGSKDAKLVSNPAPPQPAAIALDSSAVHLAIGGQYQFIAIVTSPHGGVLENAPVSWNSIDASIVTITQSGLVQGVRVGSAIITAASGPRIATATVTVAAPSPAHRPTSMRIAAVRAD
ncbi:MAG: Ig-like domain-containing protein [Gemmatimonadales bacterium]